MVSEIDAIRARHGAGHRPLMYSGACETCVVLAALDEERNAISGYASHLEAREKQLVAFAEKVAKSENDTPGTRAAAQFVLTGSLESIIDEMRKEIK